MFTLEQVAIGLEAAVEFDASSAFDGDCRDKGEQRAEKWRSSLAKPSRWAADVESWLVSWGKGNIRKMNIRTNFSG